MLSFILAVILLLLAMLSVVLKKTYRLVPAHELKRQSVAGNQLARQLYRAVGYGQSLHILLWLVLAICSAAGFILLAEIMPVWLGILSIAGLLWLSFSWLPGTRVSEVSMRVTQSATPVVEWLLHYLDPLLRTLARPFGHRYRRRHSGIYELQDLLDLLDLQATQPDSRITSEEIELIRQVLTFGDKRVRDVLRPRANVKSVALNDTVGPILLDELHASGQTIFPVKKTNRSKEIVASLQLADLGIHSKGSVADYATPAGAVINEADSLADALHAFYKTSQQLFVVVDNHDDYVGVLALEDILQTLVGSRPNDETGDQSETEAVDLEVQDDAEADKTAKTVVE